MSVSRARISNDADAGPSFVRRRGTRPGVHLVVTGVRFAVALLTAVALLAAVIVLSGCAPTVTGSTPQPTITEITEIADPPSHQLVLQIDIGTGYLQQDLAVRALLPGETGCER